MTKKVKISFLVVVWSIVAIQMYVNYHQGEEQTITAFSVVEDKSFEETIKGYGYFETVELNNTTKQNMLENLALKLGITEGYTFSGGEGDGFSKMTLTKLGKHAVTNLQIVSLYDDSKDKTGEAKQYIAMEITTSEPAKQAFNLYQKVKRVYQEIGVEPQVGMEINASERGNYVSSQGKGIFEDILKLYKAKQVDTVMENGICTVYGYTRSEDNYLTLNGKKVNIQIVLTYDEAEDTTYIKIGMPIVNSSY